MPVVAPCSITRPSGALEDKSTIPAVVLNTAATTIWRIRGETHVEELTPDPVLRSSSLAMLRDAILANAGAALLPRSMVAGDLAAGRLSCWGVVQDWPVWGGSK